MGQLFPERSVWLCLCCQFVATKRRAPLGEQEVRLVLRHRYPMPNSSTDWHLETAQPYEADKNLRTVKWAQRNAQTPEAAISLLLNQVSGIPLSSCRMVALLLSNNFRTPAKCPLCKRDEALT